MSESAPSAFSSPPSTTPRSRRAGPWTIAAPRRHRQAGEAAPRERRGVPQRRPSGPRRTRRGGGGRPASVSAVGAVARGDSGGGPQGDRRGRRPGAAGRGQGHAGACEAARRPRRGQRDQRRRPRAPRRDPFILTSGGRAARPFAAAVILRTFAISSCGTLPARRRREGRPCSGDHADAPIAHAAPWRWPATY